MFWNKSVCIFFNSCNIKNTQSRTNANTRETVNTSFFKPHEHVVSSTHLSHHAADGVAGWSQAFLTLPERLPLVLSLLKPSSAALKTAQARTTSMMALTRLLRAHFPVFARRPPSSSQWGVSGRRLQTRGAGPLHSGGSSKGHQRLWVPHPFQAILRSGHQDRHVNCTWLKCQKPGLLFNIGTMRFTYGGARTV